MIKTDPPARLPQISDVEFTDETRTFCKQWSGDFFQDVDKNPVLRTFALHPELANAYSPLNVHLLTKNTLPVKQRQIAIMRTAWICQSTYMWSSHLRTSERCGLSPDMYGPIQKGADDPYFTEFERVLILATDQLVSDRVISKAHWQALTAEWNKQQMLDFMFTVGCYAMVAGVMNSTGVQRNTNLLDLANQYGEPFPSWGHISRDTTRQ